MYIYIYKDTRWTTRVSFPPNLGGSVTNVAPHKALQSIVSRQVDVDERVVKGLVLKVHRLLYRSTLGLRVIKKKMMKGP